MQCVLVTITGHEISICEMWHRHWTTYNVIITTSVTGPWKNRVLQFYSFSCQNLHVLPLNKVADTHTHTHTVTHTQICKVPKVVKWIWDAGTVTLWTDAAVDGVAADVGFWVPSPWLGSRCYENLATGNGKYLHAAITLVAKNNQLFTPFWLQFKLDSYGRPA